MQNDLISKSELLESLNDWIDENTDINTILRWIKEYEVAYNVEKVVEKLEDVRGYHTSDDDYDCASWNAFTYAINIVRNGGKE